MFDDTIAAIATPLGEGGLAVLRLSGTDALSIADQCFQPAGRNSTKPSEAVSHTVQYGRILLHEKVVDEVLLTVFRAPHSFTREHVVEISCHGGLLIAKRVLDALLASGARIALPGEFTKRAFLNGRIDLAQAEAVADLIHARTDLALEAANEQLAGKLSRKIDQLREQLLTALAHIEAYIDFPDEDISPDTQEQMEIRLADAIGFMDHLLMTANEGQILRNGIRAAIIGRPNAGKSSLLNFLLGHDRAIVSPIAGTTRDTIEETANIRGIPLVFIDTAGLRESGDTIEMEGIRRSRASLEKAELLLHLVDASEPLNPVDEQYLREFQHKKSLVVCNKSDLDSRWVLPADIQIREARISCLTGAGLEELKDTIRDMVWRGDVHAEMLQVMINSRHQNALQHARQAAQNTLDALHQHQTLEVVALELRIAVNAVGEIVGKTSTDDLLDSIFSQFCIGK